MTGGRTLPRGAGRTGAEVRGIVLPFPRPVADGRTADSSLFTPAQPVRLLDDVIAQLHDAVDDGTLPPGRRVPPESVLAEEFAVDRRTVRRALRTLRRAGLLRARADATGRLFYVVRETRD